MAELSEARARVLAYMVATGCNISRYGATTGWTCDAFQWPIASSTFEALIDRGHIRLASSQFSNSTLSYEIAPAGRAALASATDAEGE